MLECKRQMLSVSRHVGFVSAAALILVSAFAAPVSAQPLGAGRRLEQSAHPRLTFRGRIDGSQVIEISQSHAWWDHRHWDLPSQPVSLGGVVWEPRKLRSLPNHGETRFLRQKVDFRFARLENVKGRDAVALETGDHSLRVSISDTPNGSGQYEFDIVFPPRRSGVSMRITADIDGSDELRIDNEGAQWIHRHWEWPTAVTINGFRWDPRRKSLLNPNQIELTPGVDFSSARMKVHQGRDLVVMEKSADGLVVRFADSPLGRSKCDITIDWPDPARKTRESAAAESERRNLYEVLVFQGVPQSASARGKGPVLRKTISVGRSFELNGKSGLSVSGLFKKNADGAFHFKGVVRHNAGTSEFDSIVKAGKPTDSYGGFASGVGISYFVRFDPVSR